MPCKKKKYNARFPAGRIKKIMQTDEEVGKVAQAVPVIISRTLELFVHSLLTKTMQITNARNAKTLRPSHMKQCILSESRFDFLKDLVKGVPDVSGTDDDVPTPPLTPAPIGGNVIPGATTGSAPIVHSDGRVSEEMTNWSRTTSRNSRNSKDGAEVTIVSGDTDEYAKIYVAGMPSATMTTETRPSSLQPTQQMLHQHQHQQDQQVPNFQITVPSSFHVNQPNFYTELDSTSNNNSLNAVNQPTSNFNHTANIDEDYDT